MRKVLLRRPNLRYAFAPDFVRRLQGQRVRGVSRRAKYLLVELASGDVLLMHLGMSGWFRIFRAGREELELHDHVVFEMSNGLVVVFNDPRRFGFMTLLSSSEATAHAPIARLGPEPLARRFDEAALAKSFSRRKGSLKAALMDQRVIAGVGNIYAAEALHVARLSPTHSPATLGSGQVTRLIDAIRNVLKNAIRNQYRTDEDNPFLVYDREGERCPRRGCVGIIRRIVQAGRSTFYCPRCQR